VCISAWAFPRALSWDEAAQHLTEKQKEDASQAVSAMLAFEAWISAQDRKSDHLLMNVTADGKLQLAFVDYAYSLSPSWPGPNAAVGAPAQYVPVPKHEGAMREVTESILNLDDERVKEVVSRIPGEFLTSDKASIVMSNLLSRKAALGVMLGLN
jgi:hypothetical protein